MKIPIPNGNWEAALNVLRREFTKNGMNNVQQAKRHVKRGRSLFLRKIQIPWKQWKSWNYTLVDEVTKQRSRLESLKKRPGNM
jgi:hypothetical protein